ncbi:prolipoprotein diacylglyceryl transferase [Aestuariivirga sp.]|uniref:prolipoprotein diacylglyceryl transferase n=1 Tax=Aestuariivirga sp. TaxID=2650926 RepID=UPI00391A98E7
MGYVVDFDPAMFTIAGFSVYWYGFAYSFGFAFMVLWLWRKRALLGWSGAQVVHVSLIFVVLVLACGRVFDVIVYEWPWYETHKEQIPQVWVGGMASHGLLAGSALAALVASLWTRTPLLKILDVLVVAAAFIFGVGRIGNFIEGGVIGTVTSMPWGVKLPDVEGFRHPVSLYDGAKNLLLVPVLVLSLKRWPPGQGAATAIFLAAYGGLRFLIDQFRDYESSLGGIGPGQWFNLAMALAGILMFHLCVARTPSAAPAVPKDDGRIPPVAALVLLALILLPLTIPTSWTREYIALKRSGASFE